MNLHFLRGITSSMLSSVAKCQQLESAEKHLLSNFDELLRDAVATLMLDASAEGLDMDKLNRLSTSVMMTVAADVALNFASVDSCEIEHFAKVSRDAFQWAVEKRCSFISANAAD